MVVLYQINIDERFERCTGTHDGTLRLFESDTTREYYKYSLIIYPILLPLKILNNNGYLLHILMVLYVDILFYNIIVSFNFHLNCIIIYITSLITSPDSLTHTCFFWECIYLLLNNNNIK